MCQVFIDSFSSQGIWVGPRGAGGSTQSSAASLYPRAPKKADGLCTPRREKDREALGSSEIKGKKPDLVKSYLLATYSYLDVSPENSFLIKMLLWRWINPFLLNIERLLFGVCYFGSSFWVWGTALPSQVWSTDCRAMSPSLASVLLWTHSISQGYVEFRGVSVGVAPGWCYYVEWE